MGWADTEVGEPRRNSLAQTALVTDGRGAATEVLDGNTSTSARLLRAIGRYARRIDGIKSPVERWRWWALSVEMDDFVKRI